MPTHAGNVISGGLVIPGSKARIIWVDALPTDALVGGGYRTPVNGELAGNSTNGNIYERQAAAWVRIDTL